MPSSLNKALGIIVAIPAEVDAMMQNPFFKWKKTRHDTYYSEVANILLVYSGVGKANASYALGRIIDKVSEVWIVGTSGGLGNENVGDLYLSAEFVEHDMDANGLGFEPGITPLSDMNSFLISNPAHHSIDHIIKLCGNLKIKIHTARTMSGDQFINKKEIAERKMQEFGAQIVDMESAAVAKICYREGVPVLALRIISDNADHQAAKDWNAFLNQSSALINQVIQEYCTTQ